MSSSATCTTCKGWGFVCGKCGQANHRRESKARRDFGRGCFCYRAPTVRCPTHVEVVHRCDGCGVVVTAMKFLRNAPSGAATMACDACFESWAQWNSIAFERWLEHQSDRRAGPA